MNDHDKDLISAYLDNETTADESKHVESLMESDTEALNYANQLKSANLEINQYFEGDEFEELETSVDSFLSNNLGSSSSNAASSGNISKQITSAGSIFDFDLSKIFNPYSIGGYAATAMIIMSLNLNFLDNSQQANDGSINLLDGFSSASLTLPIDKFRGPEDADFYKIAVQNLIKRKRLSGNISYGASSYFIKILSYERTIEEFDCFSGEIRERDNLSNFLYCELANQNSILISNGR
jgi:hypothetical protein